MTKGKESRQDEWTRQRLVLFRSMVRIRAFEERIGNLAASGRVSGLVHLYSGQEAVASGVIGALRPDDWIASHHRGHGHCLAKGARMDALAAEILGRRSGYCLGRVGSMHVMDPRTRNLGCNGIVGGGVPLATGAALTARRRGDDTVAVAFFGDGRKEVVGFGLATAESAAQWEQFLTDLWRRGLEGKQLEMVCTDGGASLLAALPVVYPGTPVQRCWAHKVRNVLDKVRKADHDAAKRGLHAVMNAATRTKARSAARRFADRWRDTYPRAVACLRDDLDELLTCFRYKTFEDRKRARTTNAIERRFREVRRRTRPMGVFHDRTSMDRILFAVFTYENQNQGVPTLFSLTHNS